MIEPILQRIDQIERDRGRAFSPERRGEIIRQLNGQEGIRALRSADGDKDIRKKAFVLASKFRDLAIGWSNPDSVAEAVLAHHIRRHSSIPLVGFWGEGGKPNVDGHDMRYIAELMALGEAVRENYHPGAQINIILADKHGVFNGFYRDGVRSNYLGEIEEQLMESDINTIKLGYLYKEYSLELPDVSEPIQHSSEAYGVFQKHRAHYVRSAMGHHQRGVSPTVAAFHYVEMRLNERGMLKQAFPHSFLLVNGNKMTAEPLLPLGVPILYLGGPVWFKREGVIQ